jgi:hypothetical protein
MNKISLIYLINTIILISSCNQITNNETFDGDKIEMSSKEGIDISLQLKALCEKTGLQNINPNLHDCYKMHEYGYTYYYCEATLQAIGKPMLYQIKMDKNKRIIEFTPSGADWRKLDSEPEVISEYEREEVLKAVAKVSKIFGKKYYGNGAIEKTREYYLASFSAISEEEIEKDREKGLFALDPFIYYYLSKDMNVFGIMCGAYCFRDMEKD